MGNQLATPPHDNAHHYEDRQEQQHQQQHHRHDESRDGIQISIDNNNDHNHYDCDHHPATTEFDQLSPFLLQQFRKAKKPLLMKLNCLFGQRCCTTNTAADNTQVVLPSCLEELIEWTNEATLITERIFHVATTTTKNCNNENLLFITTCKRLQCLQKNARYIPYIIQEDQSNEYDDEYDNEKRKENKKKKSTENMYENTLIIVENQNIHYQNENIDDDNNNDEILYIFTIFQFIEYLSLLRRLNELLDVLEENKVLKDGDDVVVDQPLLSLAPITTAIVPTNEFVENSSNANSRNNNNHDKHTKNNDDSIMTCTICCNDDAFHVRQGSNSITYVENYLLCLNCCSTIICYQCKTRWIHKLLNCPFCRKQFECLRDVEKDTCNQWDVTDKVSKPYIEQDLVYLQVQILKKFAPTFKNSASSSSIANNANCHYEEQQRRRKFQLFFKNNNYVRLSAKHISTIVAEDEEEVAVVAQQEDLEECNNTTRLLREEAEEESRRSHSGFVIISRRE